MSHTIRILNPSAPGSLPPAGLAPRPISLEGLRVGLLDNHKYGADYYLAEVERQLVAHHGVRSVYRHQKLTPAQSVSEHVLRELQACGAVISGIAD